ncbi:MAG: biopolymer transporter ExbD [Deltaproteobacteria bacterium]|nr:biopolymer transporter ExbD [Deltaproteobacteria bacterium]
MDEKEIDYINVIPFVDIMLVLLTIVLTTSTFIATGGIPVNLPKASKTLDQTLKVRTIEIDRKGSIFFNGRPVSTLTLLDTIRPLDRKTPFLIRADRELALQSFVDVLDTVKNAGFHQVSLQTEMKK